MSPEDEVDLRMEAEGPASWEPCTVFQVLKEIVRDHKMRPALRYKKVYGWSLSMDNDSNREVKAAIESPSDAVIIDYHV